MKTLASIIFTVICLPCIEASEVMHRAKIIKITSEIQQTPQFQFSGAKDKAVDRRYWLEIEAEVELETTDPSGFIPELKAEWFAVINDKATGKPVRLLGSTVFKNLKAKNKKVYLSAYIEPDALEQLTGKNKPSDSDIEAIALTISGAGIVNEPKYAPGLTKATAKEASKWWLEWKHVSLEGMIVAKSKTPFASLWTDRYPAEKTANP